MATLQELDQWGNLEALDTYGNLEFLDGVQLRLASASVTSALTATSLSSVTFRMTGSVSGAASVLAVAGFIASYFASPALAATSSGSFDRIRGLDASVALETSANGVYKVVFLTDGSAAVSFTTSSGNSVTYSVTASPSMEFSATMAAEVLGEDWTEVDDGTETWTIETVGSEVWTVTTDGTEIWNRQ